MTAKPEWDSRPSLAVIRVMEETHPETPMAFGISEEDIFYNALSSQLAVLIEEKIKNLMREVDGFIREADKDIQQPILFFRQGFEEKTPQTPVRLGSFLRSHLKYIDLVSPSYRLSGSNGQLTILRLASTYQSFKILAKRWSRNVENRIGVELTNWEIPSGRQAVDPIRQPQHATALSAMSVATAHMSLIHELKQHLERKILTTKRDGLAGFDAAYNHFEDSLAPFQRALYPRSADMMEGLVLLFLGLRQLVDVLNTSQYDRSAITEEFMKYPESLRELLYYYQAVKESAGFCFTELQEKQNKNEKLQENSFESAVKRMKHWDIF